MKTAGKGKTPFTEEMNTHVAPGCCVHSTFAYGDALGPLKICCDKDSVEKFVECIEYEVKRLYNSQ